MEPEPSCTTSRPLRGSYTNGNDSMSLKVVPEQIPSSNFVYRLHHPTSDKNKIAMSITDLDKIEATDDGIGISTTKAEAVIMREVADWLHSIQSDDFWTHRKKPREILSTADQLLEHLRSPQSSVDQPLRDALALNGLVDLIALQLLASCYTLLPASSASHLPFSQQRRESTHITALRLHSKHRFAPAAGHHARPSSETEPWPGLYIGPSPEETLAEAVSKQRRLKKRNSEFIPRFSGSGWTDGPAATATRGIRQQRHSITDSSSSEEIGMLSRLICQPSLAKNPRRKHTSLFLNRRSSRRRKQKQQHIQYDHQPRSSPFQRITLQAVQRIPSALRLRRTQSAPRFTIKEAALAIDAHPLRRHPSNPLIGSPISYPFEIPEIGRIGEYPGESWSPHASTTGSVRACGRGDLLVEQEYFGGSNYDWSSPSKHDYVNSLQPPHRYPNALSPSVISAVSPTNKRGSNRNQPASDYFGEMYSNKDITHHKDDPHAAEEEHSDAGPELDDDPRLQKILGGILKDDTDSSDSGMESIKKRKSLTIMTESANAEVTERFKPHYDDGLPDFW